MKFVNVKFSLRRMGVIRLVGGTCRDTRQFQVKRMSAAPDPGVLFSVKRQRNMVAKQVKSSLGRFRFNPLDLVLVGFVHRRAS